MDPAMARLADRRVSRRAGRALLPGPRGPVKPLSILPQHPECDWLAPALRRETLPGGDASVPMGGSMRECPQMTLAFISCFRIVIESPFCLNRACFCVILKLDMGG